MFKHIQTLKNKLMITVMLLLAIPMTIVIIIAQNRSQVVIREQSLTLSTNLVKTGAERIDTSCAGLNDILRAIYLNDGVRDYLRNVGKNGSYTERRNDTEQLKSIFLSSVSSRSDIFSIIFVDEQNQLIYATKNEAGSYVDYHQCSLPEDYLACIETSDIWREKGVFLPTNEHMPLRHVIQNSPSYVYAFVRQVVNTEGHFERVGTIFITVDLSDFAQMAQLIQPKNNSSVVYVCDQNGQVVYDSTGTMLMQHLPSDVLVFMDGSSQHEVSYDGNSYVMASAQSASTGWYVLMMTPQSVFSADAMSVSSAILTAALIALLLIAVFTTFASSAISKPVEQLADAMDETQLRHLDHRVEVTGQDEIARLGRSFNSLMDKLAVSIENEYDTTLQQKDAEIRALQAQMNPHFLYNVLQSMASMATLHHVPELATMATALGSTMRYNISGTGPLITLRDEIAHVENYLTIQKLRFGDRLQYDINVPEYVMDFSVPRVSVQPMAENSILHGFENQNRTGNISINSWQDEQLLIIEVADDGQGMSEDALNQLRASLSSNAKCEGQNGIGLRNLNSRLSLLYGSHSSLSIDSEEGVGTIVRITIPAKRS